jgi:hypothetical protein
LLNASWLVFAPGDARAQRSAPEIISAHPESLALP